MNYASYTIFEILKYKIEFLECLEYSLVQNQNEKKEIEKHLNHLKEQITIGEYQKIINSLFTSFNFLNKHMRKFIKKYNYKKIKKIHKCNKLKDYLKYNELMIDVYESFNNIINSHSLFDVQRLTSLLLLLLVAYAVSTHVLLINIPLSHNNDSLE